MLSDCKPIKIGIIFLLLCVCQELLAEDKAPLRLGVLSIAQPSRIYLSWRPFADYLGEKLDRPVEIVVPRGFGKMLESVSEGEVDIFYVNSHVFYRLKQAGKAVAVAQMMNIEGKTTSRSEVFVKRDSGINTIADLKGRKIAYVSPMGAGGYLAPRAYLYEAGLRSGVDNLELFTKNLSNSIYGVLLGEYDAATMCGVNYKLMSEKMSAGDLKVIAKTGEYPENVMAARSDIPRELFVKIHDVLLSMTESMEGRSILEGLRGMKIHSFVEYDESIEDITRDMLATGKL